MLKTIKVIIFIAFLICVGKVIKDKYENGEKKPFWRGIDTVQVCKVPYYSNNDCYKLSVKLVDDKNTQIYFENGGYINTTNLTCYYAAQIFDSPKYVFCRSWDDKGQQWDFMPVWAYYPSTEDLSKQIQKFNIK